LKKSCVLSHRRLTNLIQQKERQVAGGGGGGSKGGSEGGLGSVLDRDVLIAARQKTLLSLLQCEAGGMRAAAAVVVAFLRLKEDGRLCRDRAVNTL